MGRCASRPTFPKRSWRWNVATNPVVEQANNVMFKEVLPGDVVGLRLVTKLAEALHAAGLLATPEMKACAEACVDYAKWWGDGDDEPSHPAPAHFANVVAAGRAYLASIAPRERWEMGSCTGERQYWVRHRVGEVINSVGPFPTEAHAEAARKAMNEVER